MSPLLHPTARSFLRSNTAPMALVHALAYGVYSRSEDEHSERIRATS